MRRSYAWRNGQLVEITPDELEALPQIMPDVKEFKSSDGAMIGGRAQWREHLKRTGTREAGQNEIRNLEEKWNKRRAEFQQKVGSQPEHVRETEAPVVEARQTEPTRLDSEMKNRLYNRPTPDRKTLIQLTIQQARELGKRR